MLIVEMFNVVTKRRRKSG